MRRLVRRLLTGTPPLPQLSDPRSSAATKAALRTAEAAFREQAMRGVLPLASCGLRVFSQFEEDGLLMGVFAAIGVTNRVFVDLGSSDGVNSNCANLAINAGWTGVMIDGNPANIERGRAWYAKHPDTWWYPPRFINALITRENVNALIEGGGVSGEIDLLSLDIDGNDFWVLEALSIVKPRVMILESNLEFALEPLTIPYDPKFVQSGSADPYFGAGGEALRRLCARKGFRLVGGNVYGNNLIFVRRGLGETALPELSLASLREHPMTREFRGPQSSMGGRPLVAIAPNGEVER